AARGVRPALVLDEGYAVLEGLVPGVDGPVALVGVAEKGSVNVIVTARAEGGHSSMPPRRTAVTTLARAVVRIAEERPDAELAGIPERTFRALAPHMGPLERAVFANLWLFRPLVEWRLTRSPRTDALLRTTTAPTMLEGSPKTNVLPEEARAVVNFRVHPRETSDDVIAHVRRVVDDLPVEARVMEEGFVSEPSPVSPAEGPAWDALATTIRQTLEPAAIAPSLVVAGTDARHYVDLSDAVYRFAPYRLDDADLDAIHGSDESIGIAEYADMIRFYAGLIRNASETLDRAPRRGR
ncbi:MAG: M20/M25/M40 family metallo-hydrolase, partial [Gemmatimonadota bacterium]|nr:M20/M25/M40 family metallo-hydrolase [Gemmatimonadota bacterium]